MQIRLKRAYEKAADNDGSRILVDRIWPRGVTREELQLDAWLKDLAPSKELRQWFSHDPAKWEEFKRRYFAELDDQPEAVAELLGKGKKGPLTLIFAARDQQHNNAAALREYLKARALTN